jgi:polyisoprenoid-binding protein YceI
MSKFIIDKLHSEIEFKVKHLMISTVTGRFTDFDAEIISDTEDFIDAQITFEANVDSITTNIADRDNHLKSADFFDAENFPKISFKSSSISKPDDEYYVVEKEVILKGHYNGNDVDLYGNTKYGFELRGTIKRSDFGLSFNAVTDKGGLLVSDDVILNVSVQFTKAD